MMKNKRHILPSLLMTMGCVAGLASCGQCNHEYYFIEDTATCENDGVKVYQCSKCGDSYTSESPAVGHGWSKTSTTATCTEAGVNIYTCYKCHQTKEEEQKALGHYYKEDGKCDRCENNMFDAVSFSFDLPVTLSSYGYSGRNLYSKCELTKVALSKDYRKIYVTFSGTKTYDAKGEYGDETVRFNCVLKNSAGKVVSSVNFFESGFVVGQDFEKKYDLIYTNSFSLNETYTLEVVDYKY